MRSIFKKRTDGIIGLANVIGKIDPSTVALYTDKRAKTYDERLQQSNTAVCCPRRAERRSCAVVNRIVKWIPVAVCLSLVVCAVVVGLMNGAIYGGSDAQWKEKFNAYNYKASATVTISNDDIPGNDEISDFISDNKKFWISMTSKNAGIDSAYLSVLKEWHGAVEVGKWGNRLLPCAYTYVYDTRNGNIWARVLIYRSDTGDIECEAVYRTSKNGADRCFERAFSEHPGDDMIFVCIIVGDKTLPALIARDNAVYLCNSTNTKALQVFDNATDYYSALNTGCNVINSEMFK